MNIIGKCRTLGIGSLPDTDANAAWVAILDYFPEIPNWPQLPKRNFFENMYLQYSEHLPGRQIDLDNERFFINKARDLNSEMEEFYNAYLSNDLDLFKISRDYSGGIHTGIVLMEKDIDFFKNIDYIKGQITGPISFGLQVVDEEKKPILYDEMFHDILVKNLERQAHWQEEVLAKINKNVIISVDEPYLSSVGSGVLNLNREQVIKDIETIFQALTSVKATHCCGNTDWSLLMETSADILLFDAYNYSKNLALFASELQEFIARGGSIGWGIVPSIGTELEDSNRESLVKRLEDGVELLVKKGLDREVILHQSFITPSCGLGNLSLSESRTAMMLTKSVSEYMQMKYELE